MNLGSFQMPGRSLRALGAGLALAGALHAGMVQAAPLDTMIKAMKFNDAKGVRKLLGAGVDPNASDAQGFPLIVLGAREKSDDAVRALLDDRRTDIEKTDKAGENALMMASIAGDDKLVRLLIERGAEVNKTGWTPLHYAASTGNDTIVGILLEASAFVDPASPNGTTPLMMAARGGHVSTMKLLLEQGAQKDMKNQLGLTAADFAVRYNEKDAATLLGATIPDTPNQRPDAAR